MGDDSFDLSEWKRDGKGSVEAVKDGWEVKVETPFTLWCPETLSAGGEIRFACRVMTANSAMLLIAQARNWTGGPSPLEMEMDGSYDRYSSRDLEMYTVGFNRTAHVTNDVQANASTANVRRIGGQGSARYSSENVRMGTPDFDEELWNEWNTRSLLASAREFASGTSQYFEYAFTFRPPKITMSLEGLELLTLVDHRPEPLSGGAWAIRNMTPGGAYRIRDISVKPLD